MNKYYLKMRHPSKRTCSVPGCPTPIASTIHKLPQKNKEKYLLWKKICGITKKKGTHLFICSNHFDPEKDFIKCKDNRISLKKTACPSKNLPSSGLQENNRSKMIKFCILGCEKNPKENLDYYGFPPTSKMRKKWIAACQLENISDSLKNMFVCNKHFTEDDYLIDPKAKILVLKDSAVPSLKLPNKPITSEELKALWECIENVTTFIYVPSNNQKLKDMKTCKNHSIVPIDIDSSPNDHFQTQTNKTGLENGNENFNMSDKIVQQSDFINNISHDELDIIKPITNINKNKHNIDFTNFEESPIKKICQKNIGCKNESRVICALCGKIFYIEEEIEFKKSFETLAIEVIIEFQEINPSNQVEHLLLTKKGIEICDKVLSKESIHLLNLLTNDRELMAFAGINFKLLDKLTKLVLLNNKHNNQTCYLSPKEGIVMCLCKLRLNLPFSCLAMIFNIEEQSCMSQFFSWLKILSSITEKTINWPVDKLFQNLPKCYESFKQTKVILHCSQIEIEKQVCSECNNQLVHSTSKKICLVKLILGVAPSGLIIFKSDLFENQEPGEYISKKTKILDFIDSTKEAIMTDKSLNIEAQCATRNITLIKPLKEKKKQKLF